MVNTGALKPQPYEDIQEIWRRKDRDVAEKSGIDPEDQQLHTLATMPGWSTLKKHIQSVKDDLDTRLSESVLGSMSSDQIKTDVLFAVLGKRLLDSIVNKVEDSAQAVEQIINEQPKAGK